VNAVETMAIIKCKQCSFETGFGCMPTATCGLLMIPAFAVGGFLGILVGKSLWSFSIIVAIGTGILSAIIGFVIVIFAIHYIPWTLEWLFAMLFFPCPRCQQTRWAYPFTRGFGL
jgi:hypothetical protein